MEAGIYPDTCPHEDVRYIAKIKGKDAYRYYCSACYSVVDIRTGEEARSSKDIGTKMEMASKRERAIAEKLTTEHTLTIGEARAAVKRFNEHMEC